MVWRSSSRWSLVMYLFYFNFYQYCPTGRTSAASRSWWVAGSASDRPSPRSSSSSSSPTSWGRLPLIGLCAYVSSDMTFKPMLPSHLSEFSWGCVLTGSSGSVRPAVPPPSTRRPSSGSSTAARSTPSRSCPARWSSSQSTNASFS